MQFKNFINAKLTDLLQRIDPDAIYENGETATTFVYLDQQDILLCAPGRMTHSQLLAMDYYQYAGHGKVMVTNMPETATKACFGRIIKLHPSQNYGYGTLGVIANKFPGTGIVSVWAGGATTMVDLDKHTLDKTIHKLLTVTAKDIEGKSPVRLPITKDYYVVSMNLMPVYQISGGVGEDKTTDLDKQLHTMAGELHFLPYDSSRRQEIRNMAEKLKSSPEKDKYNWFISRVLPRNINTKKSPWQSEAEKVGMVKPGQKWYSMTGESNINVR